MQQLVHLLFAVVPAASQDADIYSWQATTAAGCTCTSACTTRARFECDAAPFCSVASAVCAKGNASSSLTFGFFDYCTFESFQPYEQRSAKEKQQLLLERIHLDGSSSTYPAPTSIIPGISGESVMVTFDAVADIFPMQRTRYIHSVGVTGGVSFRSFGNHKYTGLFKGAEYGLIRLSSAKRPGLPAVPGITPSFTPGVGIKLLRDGQPSANFLAMPSLDGQPCSKSNFFEYNFSNHVPDTSDWALELIAAKFWQASRCPLMVGLSDVAAEGGGVASGVFPWQLVLQPLVRLDCSCFSYEEDCFEKFGNLTPGTELFNVMAIDRPDGDAHSIGRIILSTRLVASKFGDEELFFKHQHMEDDFRMRPEWLEQIDRKKSCAMDCVGTQAPTISEGCKSPFVSALAMRPDDLII